MKFVALLAVASFAVAAPIVDDRGLAATTTAASDQNWGGAGGESETQYKCDAVLSRHIGGGWPFKRDEEERGLATTTAASGQNWGGAGGMLHNLFFSSEYVG